MFCSVVAFSALELDGVFFQALDLESVLSTKISTDSILQIYIRLTGEGEDFILLFRIVIHVLLFKCLGLDFFVD